MTGGGPSEPADRIDLTVWRAAAEASDVPMCLSDPSAPDEPLIWVNRAFTRVTGYSSDQAIGRNCRFLQGPDTDRSTIARIRDGLERDGSVTETVLNYRRDGQPFWNQLSLTPLRGPSGAVSHYVGVQDDVTARVRAVESRDDAVASERLAVDELAAASAREHEAALALQTGLLPRLQPVAGLDIAARYVPSTAGVSVGGDWYDVIELPDGRVALAVGDVMGHDLKAAAAMGQLRSMTRALAWTDPEPSHVVGRLDELSRAVLDVAFATLFYGILDRDRGSGADATMTWTRAGHPPALLRDAAGRVHQLDGVVNPPVGVIAGRPVAQTSTAVPCGSALVMFTDGLVETRQQSVQEGLDRLGEVVAGAVGAEGAAALRDVVVAAMVPEAPADDTCLLVVAPRP
ncbi:PP2C family protein-serine/threonine phosphatase [Jatrophihabitans sp. YIM 134969]